ncbi:UDP-N-acetylmuramoyl-L-alanyl-D-glutamate--2,6-diaminopimelate ligase [Thalassotalea sp. PP2-459]|nr:UDP-N-acetylmuramoyl-L-alanyl-D-glutamate--2,6-diaminopimelate ligase [Thalassotalea sp. PP2-459]
MITEVNVFNVDARYLETLLAKFTITVSLTVPSMPRQLCNDSRQLTVGDVFCAVNGTLQQGKAYISQALQANCSVILVETSVQAEHGHVKNAHNKAGELVPVIAFYQLNKQLFNVAKAFYQSPQASLNMVGVTGTNGKTSTSQLIAQLQDQLGFETSVIGTNGAGKVNALEPINNTTPGASELHALLQRFVESAQHTVVMEVSSHALAQGRVNAELFDIAVFTNLSRDHLDYHGTMENYGEAKAKIFAQNDNQYAVINGDDHCAQQWLSKKAIKQPTIVYGKLSSVRQYEKFVYAAKITPNHDGVKIELQTHCGETEIHSPLLGIFNVDNLLAAISVLLVQGIGLTEIATAITKLTPVTGRMETFHANHLPLAVVDYAHTPDALQNALLACREHCSGQLWAVFGCGGDRDKGKRKLMGQVAEKYSDRIVVTNDNPRSEQPEAIANDILSGCVKPEHITVMLDRQQAVIYALKNASQKDVVLFAGKGHENYVEIQGERHQYNEREWVSSQYKIGITQ